MYVLGRQFRSCGCNKLNGLRGGGDLLDGDVDDADDDGDDDDGDDEDHRAGNVPGIICVASLDILHSGTTFAPIVEQANQILVCDVVNCFFSYLRVVVKRKCMRVYI